MKSSEEHVVYNGQYISVTEQVIDNHIYERVRLRSGVCVIPMADDRVLMIKEYRHHENGSRWKAVTGWMDKDGLLPLDVAKEELAEEIGMHSDEWEEMPQYDVRDRTVSVPMHYFIARNPQKLEHPPENPDTDEVLESRWVDIGEYEEMLSSGSLTWDRDALYILQAMKRH